MSDRTSRNKPPKFAEDKFRVVRTCFKTFAKAFEDVKPNIHFLLDRCSVRYLDMVKEIWKHKFTHEFSEYGHYNSQLKVYNLAQENNEEWFMFVEDDYLWKEGVGKYFIEAIKQLGIVSPYDNPEFYTSETRRLRQERIILLNNWHWRTIMDTTMTIGITKAKFMYHRKVFDKWGPSDSPLWQEANDIIWCPVPSFATHFVEGKLAPSIDWTKYF